MSGDTILDDIYNKFRPRNEQEEQIFKIIKEAYQSKENINMITDIKNPLAHSVLDMFAVYSYDIGAKYASKRIKFVSKSIKEQNISENREGRRELKEMVSSSINRMVRSFQDRIMGKHYEE